MHRLKLITMPNIKGLMPYRVSRGIRMGVIIMMAALASMSIPMMRNSRFSSSRISTRLSVRLEKVSSSRAGRPEVTTT